MAPVSWCSRRTLACIDVKSFVVCAMVGLFDFGAACSVSLAAFSNGTDFGVVPGDVRGRGVGGTGGGGGRGLFRFCWSDPSLEDRGLSGPRCGE